MAINIIVQVLGGEKKVIDGIDTIGELKEELGLGAYTAKINGDEDPAANDESLRDNDFVSLTPDVKGA